MKTFFTIATLALATALVGCNNNKQEAAAPGAVSGQCGSDCTSACCATDAAAPGAVSGSECAGCPAAAAAAAPGAVSGEACGSSCTDAAPGAVSSDASGCSEGSASDCPFSGQAG